MCMAQRSSLTGLVVVPQEGDGHCPGEGSPQEVHISSGHKDLSWRGYEKAKSIDYCIIL